MARKYGRRRRYRYGKVRKLGRPRYRRRGGFHLTA